MEVVRKEDGHSWWLYIHVNQYEWRPHSCKLHRFLFDDRVACAKIRTAYFSGDSNIGALHAAYLGSTCSKEAKDANTKLERPYKGAGGCPHNAAIRTGRDFQNRGENTPKEEARDNSTIVVANFGQHPASKHHTTQRQYRKDVDAFFAKLQQTAREPTDATLGGNNLNIWASTMPLIRNDAWVRGVRDWRTLSRIDLYNEYANKVAAKHGWAILDEWELT